MITEIVLTLGIFLLTLFILKSKKNRVINNSKGIFSVLNTLRLFNI